MCNDTIKASASVVGDSSSTKTVEIDVKHPKIESVTWINVNTKEKKTKTRYEKKVAIKIETTDASGLYAFIVIESKEWAKSYIEMKHISEVVKKKGEKESKESTLFTFIPKCKWSKDAKKETEMTATVYIVFDSRTTWTVDTLGAIAKEVTGKSHDNYRAIGMDSDFVQEDLIRFGTTIVCTKEGTKSDAITLQEKKVVIVIDPGHGVTPGNAGTQARIYTYKLQDEKGGARKDEKGNVLTQSGNVIQLDQYILDDPATWIVGNNQIYNKDHHPNEKTVLDPNRTEYMFVYDISLIIIKKLREKGYEVFTTRSSRGVVSVSNGVEAIEYRRRIAHNVDADYFISLHADGDETMGFASGGHVAYNKDDEDGKELATDLFRIYTVLNKVTIGSRAHPSPRTNIGVIGEKNKIKRKALIEFGFITNPKDAMTMFTDLSQERMADQIISGLEFNINKYF